MWFRTILLIATTLMGNDTDCNGFDAHDYNDFHNHDYSNFQDHSTNTLHFGSSHSGVYDSETDTATFPDGNVVKHPPQDNHNMIYQTRDDHLTGNNPYELS